MIGYINDKLEIAQKNFWISILIFKMNIELILALILFLNCMRISFMMYSHLNKNFVLSFFTFKNKTNGYPCILPFILQKNN